MRALLDHWAEKIEETLRQRGIPVYVTGGTMSAQKLVINIETSGPLPSKDLLSRFVSGAVGQAVQIEQRPGGIDAVIVLPGPLDVQMLLLHYNSQIPPACAILGVDNMGAPILLRVTASDVEHTAIIGPNARELLRAAAFSLAARAGVNLLIAGFRCAQRWPGYEPGHMLAALASEIRRRCADRIGYPVLVAVVSNLDTVDRASLEQILIQGAAVGIHVLGAGSKAGAADGFRTVVRAVTDPPPGPEAFPVTDNRTNDRYELGTGASLIQFEGATIKRTKQDENDHS